MKPSREIEQLINRANKFKDEMYNEEIQDHMQEVYSHLQEVRLDLEEAGL